MAQTQVTVAFTDFAMRHSNIGQSTEVNAMYGWTD